MQYVCSETYYTVFALLVLVLAIPCLVYAIGLYLSGSGYFGCLVVLTLRLYDNDLDVVHSPNSKNKQ